MTTPERFAGCLVGQALGDALGAPVEGRPASVCRAYLQGVGPDRAPSAFTGQYTDDTQLARELLLSWLERGHLDPGDFARRLVDLCTSGRVVGPGLATLRSVDRLARGVPWERAGEPPPYAGNGTAMRSAPVGLLCYDDLEALHRASALHSRVTHQDPRCLAGSAVMARAVALALTASGTPDPAAWLPDLAEVARPYSKEFAQLLLDLLPRVKEDPEEVARWLHARCPGDRPGVPPFVVPSLLWSLYAFLRTPRDYLGAVRTAIAIGGDVDSTGAMTGAIAGAFLGLGALPPLARRVHDGGAWGYEDLVALARRAHRWKHSLRLGGAA